MEWSFEIDDGPSERKPSLVRESSSSSLPLTVTEKLNQEPPKQNPFLVRSPGRSDSDEPRIVMSKIRANIAQPVHVETPISPTLLPKSPPPQCPLSPVIGSPVLRTKSPLNYPSSPPVSPKGIAVRPRCHSPPVSTARVPLSPPLRPKPQVDSFFEEASEVDNGSDKRKLATSAGNWALPSPSISRKPNDQRATGSRSKHTLSPGPGISQFFGFGSSDRKKNRQDSGPQKQNFTNTSYGKNMRNGLSEVIPTMRTSLKEGFYSINFNVSFEEAFKSGVPVEDVVVLLLVQSDFREQLWRSFILTYPAFTASAYVLDCLIESIYPSTELNVVKFLQFWITEMWEEEWRGKSRLWSTLTQELKLGDRFEPSSRSFLLNLLRVKGDKQKIALLSQDFPGEDLTLLGVVEGESRKSRKEKSKSSSNQKKVVKLEGAVCPGCEFESYGFMIECKKCLKRFCNVCASLPKEIDNGCTDGTPHEYLTEKSDWEGWDELWFAQQLALFHWELLSQIPPRQFIQWPSSRNKKIECPDLWAFVSHFNSLVSWAISEVVVRIRCSERVRIMEKLILIAHHSLALNNFYGSKILLTALDHPAVSRLSKTQEQLSKQSQEKLNDLQEKIGMDENGKEYRGIIRSCPSPYVPFLGIHSKDLIYLQDGNPNFLYGDVNILKFWKIWQITSTLFGGLTAEYEFTFSKPFRNWITNEADSLEEDEVFFWSKRVEPSNVETLIASFVTQEFQWEKERDTWEIEKNNLEIVLHQVTDALLNISKNDGDISKSLQIAVDEEGKKNIRCGDIVLSLDKEKNEESNSEVFSQTVVFNPKDHEHSSPLKLSPLDSSAISLRPRSSSRSPRSLRASSTAKTSPKKSLKDPLSPRSPRSPRDSSPTPKLSRSSMRESRSSLRESRSSRKGSKPPPSFELSPASDSSSSPTFSPPSPLSASPSTSLSSPLSASPMTDSPEASTLATSRPNLTQVESSPNASQQRSSWLCSTQYPKTSRSPYCSLHLARSSSQLFQRKNPPPLSRNASQNRSSGSFSPPLLQHKSATSAILPLHLNSSSPASSKISPLVSPPRKRRSPESPSPKSEPLILPPTPPLSPISSPSIPKHKMGNIAFSPLSAQQKKKQRGEISSFMNLPFSLSRKIASEASNISRESRGRSPSQRRATPWMTLEEWGGGEAREGVKG